jgi:hypothetical protein
MASSSSINDKWDGQNLEDIMSTKVTKVEVEKQGLQQIQENEEGFYEDDKYEDMKGNIYSKKVCV